MIRTSVLAVSLLALAGFLTIEAAGAQDLKPTYTDRLIWLTGHGEVKTKPNLALVTAGVVTQAGNARDALSANSAAMAAVLTALKAAGIAEKDVQTSNFGVNPRYVQQESEEQRLVGYDVSNTVVVSVRDLAKLGSLLDAIVSEGSNQINGIVFQIADPVPFEDEARRRAIADAKRKADLYASAAGVKLGQVVAISEGMLASPPVPILGRAMAKAEAAAVPIAQGEQTMAIDVNVAWEIK